MTEGPATTESSEIIQGSLHARPDATAVLARADRTDRGLIFFDESDGSEEISFARMELSVGGHDGQHIFVRDTDSGVSFSTAQPSLLELIQGTSVTDALRARVDEARAELHRTRRGNWVGGAVVLAVLLAIGVLLWNVPNFVAMSVDALPTSTDRALGDAAFDDTQLEGAVVDDPAVVAFVDEVVQRLATQASVPGFEFRVLVVESEQLNAYALPGGQIVVYTGLLRAAEHPREVAGVLAHEMAHVTRRHGMRNMAHQVGLVIGLQLLLGDASGWTAMAAEAAAMAKSNGYSRTQEADADAEGTRMLVAAGLDPEGLVEFFQRLQGVPGSELSGAMTWLSTHPDHASRISHVREVAAAQPKTSPRPLESDWGALKVALGDAP